MKEAFIMLSRLVSALLLGTLMLGNLPATAAVNAPNHKLRDGVSANWSGYIAETRINTPQTGSVSDVQGQWTVPTLTCNATSTYSSAWVGIDGWNNNTVEQTGTEQDCFNGQPVYSAWYEMYPKFPVSVSVAVHPGDVMKGEVHFAGSNQFILTITNLTTGQSFCTTQKASAKRFSAEWIVEAPSSAGTVLPLSNFGTTTFTNASASIGKTSGPLGSNAWQHDAITMATPSGAVKATPSALDAAGQSFSDTWLHQ